MSNPNWVETLSAIGAIATPLLILVLTGIGWSFRAKLDRKIHLENQLRGDRIEIYNQILEPFIILFTSEAAWKSDPEFKNKDKTNYAQSKLMSVKYRELGFRLSLMGTDNVVRAYNNLWQYFFRRKSESEPTVGETKEMIKLLGQFLLEIRKSMGNEGTKLSNLEMLEWFFTDARNIG